ncbi:hypothetical protein D917_09269 [Trichinella nativa]|uniref:Uncharacterized protein n=1 Tax=Trichinella nativa TaxID=6335 RepID=A0A1Y3EMB7_9BILA|nr:hypothetical protein D917_04352 [Trichinella nativa]OUC44248.1 hypothetical protein D917_09269 [Trichinella nativa]
MANEKVVLAPFEGTIQILHTSTGHWWVFIVPPAVHSFCKDTLSSQLENGMKLVETAAYGPLNPLQTTLSVTTLHNSSGVFFPT